MEILIINLTGLNEFTIDGVLTHLAILKSLVYPLTGAIVAVIRERICKCGVGSGILSRLSGKLIIA